MNYQRPKGTNDILLERVKKWQFVEETARLLFGDYQYQEIRTPMFEHYEVIAAVWEILQTLYQKKCTIFETRATDM